MHEHELDCSPFPKPRGVTLLSGRRLPTPLLAEPPKGRLGSMKLSWGRVATAWLGRYLFKRTPGLLAREVFKGTTFICGGTFRIN